jgi:hypothetical protein
MFTRFLRLGALLAISVTAVACADSVNDAPIIDSVEAPLVVSERNGAYSIPVTVLFHDNDSEAITHVRYRLRGEGAREVEGIIDVPAPNPTLESAHLTIVIPSSELEDDSTTIAGYNDDGRGPKMSDEAQRERARNKGRGRRALQLIIVDGRGAESLPQSSPVTLQ